PEPNDAIRDPWLRHLFASGTLLAAFDGAGRPATIADLLPGQSAGHPRPTTTGVDVSTALLASTSTPRGPSQAMRADITSPDPSLGRPSDPTENDGLSGVGLAHLDQAFQDVLDLDLGLDRMDTPTVDKDWVPGGTDQDESLYPPHGVSGMDVAWTPSMVGDDATAPVEWNAEAYDLTSLDPALLDPASTSGDLLMPDPDLDRMGTPTIDEDWVPGGTDQDGSWYPPYRMSGMDVAWTPPMVGDATAPVEWNAEAYDLTSLDPALLDPASTSGDLLMPDPDLDRMGTPTIDKDWVPGGTDQDGSWYPPYRMSGMDVAWTPPMVGDDATAPVEWNSETYDLTPLDPALLDPASTSGDLLMPDPRLEGVDLSPVPAPVPFPPVPAGLLRSGEWDRLFTRFSRAMGLGFATGEDERTRMRGAGDVRHRLRVEFDPLIDRTDFAERNGLSPADVATLRQALDARGTSALHLKEALLRLMSEVYEVNIILASAGSLFHDNYGSAPSYPRMVALDLSDTPIMPGPASLHAKEFIPASTARSAIPHPSPQPSPPVFTTALSLPEPPPPHVVNWRPRDGGPTTLREYLETLELPTGVSLNTDRQGRLTPGMAEWVKAWALGLQNETTPDGHRYTLKAVAELSGNLITKPSVARWWKEAGPSLPPPPPDVVNWRPRD
ncbi:hypothetical protein, partial [Micromonospora olivasterospora]|uniref:hypothetical protein n=1 Tax=Micromonospora olivasterospora TaxID=1880 RepID=UPI0031DF871A